MEKLRKLLGAAIIIKNGQETIGKTFDSLLAVCGQIVVVDTGSDDKSPVISASYGAELHFFKWTDDFSEARNYSLQFIRKPWALVIDADEVLDVESLKDQSFLLENEKIGGIKVNIENYLDKNNTEVSSSHQITRIFRNRKDYRFEGKVHEQIREPILNSGLEIVSSDIKIYHSGYAEINEEKTGRNRELLENELHDKQDDDWLKYHLAETEFAAYNIEKARSIFEELIDSKELGLEQLEISKIRLGQIYLSTDDYEKAQSILEFESKNVNREGLRKYVLGSSYLMQKKFSEALTLYKSPEIQLSKLVDKKQLERAIEHLPVIGF